MITIYLLCTGMILLYLIFSYMLGDLFLSFTKSQETSLSYRIILGFFLFFLLFQAAALPLKFTLQPLSLLAKLWCFLLAVTALLYFLRNRKILKEKWNQRKELLSEYKWIFLFLIFLVMIQICLTNYNGETYALWDQSYYIGDVSSSVYTDTISQYSPYTGHLLDRLDAEYLLETYQNHSAVICTLTGLAPLIETRTVETTLMVIMANLIYYQLGRQLFPLSRKKSALLVFCLFWLNLFSFNLYTSAEFLFFRAFEGKTILACIIMPAVFLLFLKIAREYRNHHHWMELFLIIWASFGLNMSAIYMLPFELSICLIPLGFCEKDTSVLCESGKGKSRFRLMQASAKPLLYIWIRYAVCLFPCILYGAAYLLTKHHLFIYTG